MLSDRILTFFNLKSLPKGWIDRDATFALTNELADASGVALAGNRDGGLGCIELGEGDTG